MRQELGWKENALKFPHPLAVNKVYLTIEKETN